MGWGRLQPPGQGTAALFQACCCWIELMEWSGGSETCCPPACAPSTKQLSPWAAVPWGGGGCSFSIHRECWGALRVGCLSCHPPPLGATCAAAFPLLLAGPPCLQQNYTVRQDSCTSPHSLPRSGMRWAPHPSCNPLGDASAPCSPRAAVSPLALRARGGTKWPSSLALLYATSLGRAINRRS